MLADRSTNVPCIHTYVSTNNSKSESNAHHVVSIDRVPQQICAMNSNKIDPDMAASLSEHHVRNRSTDLSSVAAMYETFSDRYLTDPAVARRLSNSLLCTRCIMHYRAPRVIALLLTEVVGKYA